MNKIIELKRNDFFNKTLDTPLRKMSNDIFDFGNELSEIISNLKMIFESYEISVGLAAPQIGINKRILIVNLNKNKNKDLIIINPKIISNTGKTKESFESCLSLPRYKGKVKRKDNLIIEYFDENGINQRLETSGFMARVILHEIDHLNGVLFVDRIDSENSLEEIDFEWK